MSCKSCYLVQRSNHRGRSAPLWPTERLLRWRKARGDISARRRPKQLGLHSTLASRCRANEKGDRKRPLTWEQRRQQSSQAPWAPRCAFTLADGRTGRWRSGREVNSWRNANVASICMSHGPCTEAILRATSSQTPHDLTYSKVHHIKRPRVPVRLYNLWMFVTI